MHGFAGFDECREVHHSIDALLLKNSIHRGAIRNVSNNELRACGHSFLAAVREIVVDDDVVAPGEKLRRNDTADVSGPSGNKNALGHLALPLCIGVRLLSCPKAQGITSRIERERQGRLEASARGRR